MGSASLPSAASVSCRIDTDSPCFLRAGAAVFLRSQPFPGRSARKASRARPAECKGLRD